MENTELLEKALENLDLKYEYDNDDDIVFENNMGKFSLVCEKNFISITYPNFYEVAAYSEKIALLNIFDEIHSDYKAVKLFFINSSATASVETFFGNESNFEYIIMRSLKVLSVALSQFSEEAKKVLDLSEEG